MTRFFLSRRAAPLLAIMLVLLFVVRLLKDDLPTEAIQYSALWSFLSTVVFVLAHLYRQGREQKCALCDELPDRNSPA